jgi:GNAT superfamily N-acetyltransferase
MDFPTMLETLAISVLQFIEEERQSGIKNAFRKSFFIDAEVVPVVKDLENVKPANDILDKYNLKLVDITIDEVPHFNYPYRFKSRLLKVKRNVKNGFKALSLASNNIIVGDIWYVTWESTRHPRLHEDVELLFLNPGEKDVYMFDMFIDPEWRGKNIAVALMGSALFALGKQGYRKAFGFFEMKNIPALWTHRTLKFNELDHVFFSRYFLKRISRKKVVSLRK